MPPTKKELEEIKKLADEEAKKVKQTSDNLVEKNINILIRLGEKIASLETEILKAMMGGSVGLFAGLYAGAKIGTLGGIAFGPWGAATGGVFGAGLTVWATRPARRKKLEEQIKQQKLEEDIALSNLKSSFKTAEEIKTRIEELPRDAPQRVRERLWDLYQEAMEASQLAPPDNDEDIPRRKMRTAENTSSPVVERPEDDNLPPVNAAPVIAYRPLVPADEKAEEQIVGQKQDPH